MNLLIKRNTEEFLRLLGNDCNVFENEFEFNSFDFFIENLDEHLFFTFSIKYNYNRFINLFSAFSPEKTVGVITHVFVYEDKLCVSYMLTHIDVIFFLKTYQQHIKIIEKVVRSIP